MLRPKALRVEFSKEHDAYLYKYLARYCPSKEGRSGKKIFQCLVANEGNVWPWSVHHTWQSWRERYVKNADHFDAFILKYQRKHNIKPVESKKRAAEPMPIEMLGPSAKRVKLVAKESATRSGTRTGQDAAAQNASPSPSRSKLMSRPSHEPQEAPSQAHPTGKPEPTDVTPSSPPRSSNNTNTDATTKPHPDTPAPQMRPNTLEISSSSPNQPVSPPMNGEPEPRSPPRAVKRKERPRDTSEVFASEPPSPRREPTTVDVRSSPVTNAVYPRAPPRVVDSLHGRVLVDQKGHVPCAFPHGDKDAVEREEVEDMARWPPTRGRTAKQRTASGPDVKVNAHHAFSQPQPQPRPEGPLEGVAISEPEQERGKPRDPFKQVSRPLDRHIAAALFLAKPRHGVAPQVENEQREDTTKAPNTPTTLPPTLPSDLIPNPASKALRFPAPRAPTQSPFRPELPAEKTRRPPPRPQLRTKAARHPALSRIRRQTIGYGHGNANRNGDGHESGPGRRQVPSIDLVALSCSSTSTRSRSRSSAGPSVPTRPPRWSLPMFARPTSWVIDELESVPSAPDSMLGSEPGSLFKRVTSSSVYPDIWKHARRSSFGETSTPRFTFTPSPARSVTAVAPDTNASPSLSINPHPPDVSLTASHGLASILAHMSVNHGLALGVVEAVYTRVGSLRGADEVLKGMREAAEEFGEREINRRVRGRHGERRGSWVGRGKDEEGRQGNGDGKERKRTLLRYVVTSEDGEESEYSPPETSRAAMWKRQSESASYEKGMDKEENGVGEDRDEEEGRAVEEELWEKEREGENDNEKGLLDHDFLRALLANKEAQELERRVGKRQFRRNIVKRFI